MEKISHFTPAPGFILLKITEPQPETILVAQDTDKTPASTGIVVAVRAPMMHDSGQTLKAPVEVGDMVVFKPYSVDSLYLNNIEHRIVPFGNVRGVLRNGD